ncbi:putative altered inheritance of mitochondria protein [Septoria linicola]|nr:putative altered inheritance of mitochondria protein [Septoria linicola]
MSSSSWWDKYFAPGDIRQSRPIPQETISTQDEIVKPEVSLLGPKYTERADASTRARRQHALLYGGLAFTLLSAIITRRALNKKHLAAYPQMVKQATAQGGSKLQMPTFAPSNTPPKAEGGLDAAEALGLATLSVFSVFMAGTGLFMKLNNIGDVEDLRDWVRAGVGYDVYAGDTEADKEIEQWMAEILARKDGVGDLKTTIVEKMAELAELDKKKQEAKEAAGKGELQRKIEALKKEVEKS